MQRVLCKVLETELENDEGRRIEGVIVTCQRCDHETQSFGTSERSVNRCLVLLREECGLEENNYYVIE